MRDGGAAYSKRDIESQSVASQHATPLGQYAESSVGLGLEPQSGTDASRWMARHCSERDQQVDQHRHEHSREEDE